MNKKVMLVLLAVSALLASCKTVTTSNTSTTPVPSVSATAGPRQGGTGVDKSGDAVLKEMASTVAPLFQTFTYHDEQTGRDMQYALFTPMGYDPSVSYPLVLFMPDASLVGKGVTATLTQGWGGLIWATEESQKEHPCFVLVPTYTGPDAATNDDYQVSDEADVTYRMLKSVIASHAVDEKRVYTTGQSMGCMLSFYLNITYPDLFTASLFVSGHWDPVGIGTLAGKNFFYISSEADTKFAAKIDAVKTNLLANGATIAENTWSAKLSAEEQDALVEEMLKKGCNVNLVEFTKGTVAPEGLASTNADFVEHMYAFDHAYMIPAVRNWLFSQSK